jgi:ABC-type transport system involved in multi-copper enzyme maturation permease subunit
MSRTRKVLVGAAIGFGAGIATALLRGPESYIPQTTGGWLAFFFIYSIPWIALGALIGFLLSLKRFADIRSERIRWKPLYLANPLNWLKALWRLEPTMTVMLLIWLALGVPMTLGLNYGVRPQADLLPGAFITLAFWIVLMFVVAGIKRAIVWLWRTLRRHP